MHELNEQEPELETEEIVSNSLRRTNSLLLRDISDQQKIQALISNEKQARTQLHNLRNGLTVTKPRGVGLSRRLANEWNSYQSQLKRLYLEVFRPAEASIEMQVSIAAEQAHIPLDDIVRLNLAVSKYKDDALKAARRLRSETTNLSNEIFVNVKTEVSDSFQKVKRVADKVMDDLEYMRNVPEGVGDLAEVREKFVERIVSVHETEKLNLERLRDQLNLVANFWTEDGYDSAELTEALEEELDELTAQRDADFELAQIGMALNTISHEFDKTVGSLRNGLRKLKAWADMNPELRDLYRELRVSFDHLDEYLAMFTPLDRRLHRTRIYITGKQIHDYLSKLFKPRLNRHKVTLAATEEFLKSSTLTFPPRSIRLSLIWWITQFSGCNESMMERE